MKKIADNGFAPPSLSLRGAAAAVFRRKWLIAAAFVTAATAAGLVAFLMPEKYESRMKILVRNMRADAPVTAGSEAPFDRNEVSESQIVSEIELLKSRDLLEKIVIKARLVGGAGDDKEVEKAVLKLEKDLRISPVKKANIIEISYSSTVPETAALVLKELSVLYLDKHLQVHHPPGAYDFFRDQAETYEQQLRDSESRLSSFQQKEEVVTIQQQKDLLLVKVLEANSKLKDLEGSINEGENRIGELETQLKGTQSRVVTQSRVLPNQFSVERLNTLLVELRNRRIQLLAKYQPNDRVVREVDEQIEQTTEALQKARQSTAVEQATDLNPLRQQLESDLAKARVEQKGRLALRENLETQARQYRDQLVKLERATTTHSDLSRKVKEAENNYQLYAKKEEESRINDALDKQKISNVSVAEQPTVPLTPNKNNRLLAVVAGLSIWLMISLGGVFIAEITRETFATPQELESFAGVAVLATMPLNWSQTPGFELTDGAENLEPVPTREEEEEVIELNEPFDDNLYSYSYRNGNWVR